MGLDMYLNKRTYIGNNYAKKSELIKIVVPKSSKKTINVNRVTEIEEQIGYWRKANAIHNWFVKNVQGGEDNCKSYYVSPEQLQELLDVVQKVIASCKLVNGKIHNGTSFKDGKETQIIEEGKVIQNYSLAEELLPATSGFFFGSTDYNQYYLEDLKETEKILKNALKEKGGDIYYQSSW